MKQITVYDYEGKKLESIAEDNDMTVAELVELLMEFIDQCKALYMLK